jgi:hypothetical protein
VGYATPEEAAREGTPPECVRVVCAVVRGDEAVVGQLMNADQYPDSYEVETVQCHRASDGWEAGSSGNGNTGFIRTGNGLATVVVWLDKTPLDARAARFVVGEQAAAFPVQDGFVSAVFDEVALDHEDWPHAFPVLDEWIREARTI